jgi:hypothetical protein
MSWHQHWFLKLDTACCSCKYKQGRFEATLKHQKLSLCGQNGTFTLADPALRVQLAEFHTCVAWDLGLLSRHDLVALKKKAFLAC